MKKLNTNFDLLIFQLLPPHKRQAVRVKFLQALFNLESLYLSFVGWRQDQRRLLNINSQIKRFEGYLRQKFHPLITIKSKEQHLTGISLLKEGVLELIGLLPDENLAPFALLGEFADDIGEADFLVIAPEAVDTETLSIEIDKFKLADKKYKIKIIDNE